MGLGRIGGGAECDRLAALAGHGLGHGLRHAPQVLLGETVDVAEVGGVANHHADRGAHLAAALRALHAPVVQGEGEAGPLLHVQLGQVAASRERAREEVAGELGGDHSPAASVVISSASSSSSARPGVSSASTRACPAES